MLKIQELDIDGEKFRLREPRLSDYLRARKAPADEFVFTMLAGMLLDDKGKEVGEAAVQNLPLRVFDVLSEAVSALSAPRKAEVPLDQKSEGSTASLSPSGEQPSEN